jgi:uncharacterized circularly permuted ATP-grasp superfamily protein
VVKRKNGNIGTCFDFVGMKPEELTWKQKVVERRMMEEGITFTLYDPAQHEMRPNSRLSYRKADDV